MLRNIPASVNDRLARLSSCKEIFDAAIPPYQRALDEAGYNFQLEYKDFTASVTKEPCQKKNRSRRVTYFNPPFALNVKTNIRQLKN